MYNSKTKQKNFEKRHVFSMLQATVQAIIRISIEVKLKLKHFLITFILKDYKIINKKYL